MRPQQQLLAGMAGALGFAGAAAAWCAIADPGFEAAAPIAIVTTAAATKGAIDVDAAKILLATEPVLRRAAMRPEAAAAIERCARPSLFDRFAALAAWRPANVDTLSRATAFLSARVDLRAGALPDTIDVVARMPAAADAAAIATATAEAFASDLNETMFGARARGADSRAGRLDRASRRLAEARERTEALKVADPAPVASISTAAPADGSGRLDRLRREAQATETRRADAARIYGPRHPQLVQREKDARNAKAALDEAMRVAAPTPAEGGPDPRDAEIAAAEEELTQAQKAYERELSRNETDRPEARVLRPAPLPARSAGAPGGLVIASAGLAGFLLCGLGRAAMPGRPRAPAPLRDRLLANLGHGGLGPRERRSVLDQMSIAEGRGARKILVVAEDARLARAGADALAAAAQAEGWRPLVIAPETTARASDDAKARFASLDGRALLIREEPGLRGAVSIARRRRGVPARERAIDASLAFDVVFEIAAPSRAAGGRAAPRDFDALIRVSHALSDEQASHAVARSAIDPELFLGTMLCAETRRPTRVM